MKKMVIKRVKEIKDATIGVFSIFDELGDELLTGYTLEPEGPDTTVSNQDKRIPQGRYSAVWSYSPKFKRKLPLLFNESLNKDRRILIHSGNYGKDTSGCIIIGSDLGKNGIFNSIKKFKEFLEVVKFDNFIVEIDNAGAIWKY